MCWSYSVTYIYDIPEFVLNASFVTHAFEKYDENKLAVADYTPGGTKKYIVMNELMKSHKSARVCLVF